MVEVNIPILLGRTLKVRVLRPSEYEAIRSAAKSLDNQTKLDALLLLGARYVEAQRLQARPGWFAGKFVHLPEEASRKVKRKQVERWVRLNPLGETVLPHFFPARRLPSWKSWSEDLRRWAERAGMNPAGLSPKTTRKTWESWLVSTYPNRVLDICLSQGHTEAISLKYYVNMPFTDEEKKRMERWTAGWI